MGKTIYITTVAMLVGYAIHEQCLRQCNGDKLLIEKEMKRHASMPDWIDCR